MIASLIIAVAASLAVVTATGGPGTTASYSPLTTTIYEFHQQSYLMSEVSQHADRLGTSLSGLTFPLGTKDSYLTSQYRDLLYYLFKLQEYYVDPSETDLAYLGAQFPYMSSAIGHLLVQLTDMASEANEFDYGPIARALLSNVAQGYNDYVSLLAPALVANGSCDEYSVFVQAAAEPDYRVLRAASVYGADPVFWTFPSTNSRGCTINGVNLNSLSTATPTAPPWSTALIDMHNYFATINSQLRTYISTYSAPPTSTGIQDTTSGSRIPTGSLEGLIVYPSSTSTNITWLPGAPELSQAIRDAKNALPNLGASDFAPYATELGSVAAKGLDTLEVYYNKARAEDVPNLSYQITAILGELSGFVANHIKAVQGADCSAFASMYSTVDLFSQAGAALLKPGTSGAQGFVYFPFYPGAALSCLTSYTRPQLNWTNANQVRSTLPFNALRPSSASSSSSSKSSSRSSSTSSSSSPSSSASASTSSPGSTSFPIAPHQGLSTGAKIGIGVGVGVGGLGVLLAALALLVLLRHKKQPARASTPAPEPGTQPPSKAAAAQPEIPLGDKQQPAPNFPPPAYQENNH